MEQHNDLTPEKTNRLIELITSPDTENHIVAEEILNKVVRTRENIGYLSIIYKFSNGRLPKLFNRLIQHSVIFGTARGTHSGNLSWNSLITIMRDNHEFIDELQKHYVRDHIIYYINNALNIQNEQTRESSQDLQGSDAKRTILWSISDNAKQIMDREGTNSWRLQKRHQLPTLHK
jgi:hypothetical protein